MYQCTKHHIIKHFSRAQK